MARQDLNFWRLCVALLICGCSATTQVTHTPRSSIEQRLLVQSLDRALDKVDVEPLQGKTVGVEFFALTPDKDFAKEFVTAWLQTRKIKVVGDVQKAEVRVKIFAPVLGVDQGQTFFGVPTVTVPILGFTVPEIALFKSMNHRGYAALEMYSIDNPSGDFLKKSPRTVGEAEYNQYTVLILVHFNRNDLDDEGGQ